MEGFDLLEGGVDSTKEIHKLTKEDGSPRSATLTFIDPFSSARWLAFAPNQRAFFVARGREF